MSITSAEKKETIEKYRRSDSDTGSPEVQVAVLTHKINALTEHLRSNKKDHASRRGLLAMVSRRRSLLDYLKRIDAEKYQSTIESLSLRK